MRYTLRSRTATIVSVGVACACWVGTPPAVAVQGLSRGNQLPAMSTRICHSSCTPQYDEGIRNSESQNSGTHKVRIASAKCDAEYADCMKKTNDKIVCEAEKKQCEARG
jgi:hypothetical protein